ncbi:hypothetical protein [Streptomyces sp. 2231.1]|uniref:hypothetical protein n=1 Tax=Streptomyces sp. 2231.1 TaxID=1855347 RepID=UPI00115F95AA|nr:hypothetical protein [Streptomyces sp. 2231.1]
MEWLMAAVVGTAGGLTMEAVDVIKAIKWHRKMPWNVQSDTVDPPQRRPDIRPGEESLPAPGWKAYCVAGALRLLVSGTLAGVIAASYPQATVPFVSYIMGLGALAAVQQATSLVPLMVKSAGRAALGNVVDAAQPQSAQFQTASEPPQARAEAQPSAETAAHQEATGTGGGLQ